MQIMQNEQHRYQNLTCAMRASFIFHTVWAVHSSIQLEIDFFLETNIECSILALILGSGYYLSKIPDKVAWYCYLQRTKRNMILSRLTWVIFAELFASSRLNYIIQNLTLYFSLVTINTFGIQEKKNYR